MRGEMPENMGFGEMPEGETFGNVPQEFVHSPKFPEADLNLDNKKALNFIDKTEEEKTSEDEKDNLSDKVRQELRVLPKIDSKNYQEVAKQVAEKLGIKSKEDMDLLEAKVGVRRNIYQNLERVKMMDKEGQEKAYRDFALEDAKWMQKVGECIKNIKKDKMIPAEEKGKKIADIWQEMKDIYNDYEIYYKDFKFAGGKKVDDFESNKNGILGQIAAEELFGEAGVAFKDFGVTGIKIEPATPHEDVDKKTDFYVVVEFGENSSIVFPCQVKSHALDIKSGNFIASNLVVRVGDISREDLKLSARDRDPSNCEKNTIEDVEIFRKKALKEFKEGFLVIVPYGKAEIGEKGKADLLQDNGNVHENIRKGFLRQLAKKMLNIDNFQESGIMSKQKKRTAKKGGYKK